MKRNYLTIEQVNLNLQKQFPGKPIECTKAETCKYHFTEQYFYVIETPKMKVAVSDYKKVYAMFTPDVINNYEEERSRFRVKHTTIEIFGEVYTEFIMIPSLKDEQTKEAKEECDKLLIATGYKKEKAEETTEQKLKRIIGFDYVRFYKLVKEVKVIGYEFKQGIKYTGHYKLPEPANFDVLLIKHSTGSFSFPITNLYNTDWDTDTFVQNAFCELLGCANPYTLAALEEIKVPEPVLSKVLSINRSGKLVSMVRRLKTMSKLHLAA